MSTDVESSTFDQEPLPTRGLRVPTVDTADVLGLRWAGSAARGVKWNCSSSGCSCGVGWRQIDVGWNDGQRSPGGPERNLSARRRVANPYCIAVL